MKTEILSILKCPRCDASLQLAAFEENPREVRKGRLTCTGSAAHAFDVEDGIIRFAVGFDHEAVKKELHYENTTYQGSDRLTDPHIIAQFPETLTDLWPHTCNFGPDFRALIEQLKLAPGAWVLDVGTGPCWSTRLLAERGCRTIAMDVNEANFYGLKTSDILFDAHNVYFERILESMTHMPFRDETLDCIAFNASFHHTPDMDLTLRECFRVLKPGGTIGMVNEEFASVRQRLFPEENVTDTGSHHSIRYKDFERSVKEAGFAVEYYVAEHVRQRLSNRFSSLGGLAVKVMETFPLSLKQLNSAVVLLRKPAPPGATRTSRPITESRDHKSEVTNEQTVA